MASRTLNRRALRDQNDDAEKNEKETEEKPESDDTEDAEPDEAAEEGDEPEEVAEGDAEAEPEVEVKKTRKRKASTKVPKVKGPAKPRVRKKSVKAPPRRIARWAVCDGSLKRLAVFEFKERDAADAKLAQLREEKKGPFVLQLVKDPYEPPEVPVAV